MNVPLLKHQMYNLCQLIEEKKIDKDASTFKYVKIKSPLERYITFLFKSNEVQITDLYLNEEDHNIDEKSIQNDFNVVFNDLNYSVDKFKS